MNDIQDLIKAAEYLKSKGIDTISLESIEKLSEITTICFSQSLFYTENLFAICDILSDSCSIENFSYKEDLSSISEYFKFCLVSLFPANNENYINYNSVVHKFIEETFHDYSNYITPEIHSFQFDSLIKLRGTVRQFNNEKKVIITGAAENVLNKICWYLKNNKIEEIDLNYLLSISEKVQEFQKNGKRVIVIAITDLPEEKKDFNDFSLNDLNYCFVGLVTIHEDLNPNSQNYIQELENLKIKPIICTGYYYESSLSILKRVGFLEDENNLIHNDCFSKNEDEVEIQFDNILKKNRIAFCRQSPDDIMRIVKNLTRKGEKVAFVGDCTNEALAMKQSYIGIGCYNSSDIIKSICNFLCLEKDILPRIIEVFKYIKHK